MKIESIQNKGEPHVNEEIENTRILSSGTLHTSTANAYSNGKDKTNAVEKLFDTEACAEEHRKPTTINDVTKNAEFKTKHTFIENEISNGKPETYYFNVVSNEILLFFLFVFVDTALFTFFLYQCKKRLSSSDTDTNKSQVSSSQLEIEFLLSESVRNNSATENVSKTGDRVRVNNENILRTKNAELKPIVQVCFRQQQPERIEGKQTEGKCSEIHPETKQSFSGYRTKTEEDGRFEIYEQKEEKRNRKTGKDNSRKKVKNKEKEVIKMYDKNSVKARGRSDESGSKNIKRQNQKKELSSESTSKPSTRAEHSMSDDITGDRQPNFLQSQMRDIIFLQQGDLRFQYIPDKNSNFIIEYKAEERLRTGDIDKFLKYKLRVKKKSMN